MEAVLLAAADVTDDDADVQITVGREREVLDTGDRRSLECRLFHQAGVMDIDVPGANAETT